MILNLMKEVESLAQEKGIALPGNIVAASLRRLNLSRQKLVLLWSSMPQRGVLQSLKLL